MILIAKYELLIVSESRKQSNRPFSVQREMPFSVWEGASRNALPIVGFKGNVSQENDSRVSFSLNGIQNMKL